MTSKQNVLEKYPDAYSAQDIDGFWWIWTPKRRGALNDARYQTRSAAKAWASAQGKLNFEDCEAFPGK